MTTINVVVDKVTREVLFMSAQTVQSALIEGVATFDAKSARQEFSGRVTLNIVFSEMVGFKGSAVFEAASQRLAAKIALQSRTTHTVMGSLEKCLKPNGKVEIELVVDQAVNQDSDGEFSIKRMNVRHIMTPPKA